MEGERKAKLSNSKRRSTTSDYKMTVDVLCSPPNYKLSLQPISPGVSPIKKPKNLKTKKGNWKSIHNDLEKVKKEVYDTNSKFIAKHKISQKPTEKPRKLEFMIKQCLFKEKACFKFEEIEIKKFTNLSKKDEEDLIKICSISQGKAFKINCALDKSIDFKLFETILENWGFEDNENYGFEYSEIDITSKNVSFVVRLVERSVQNYDLEDTKKTFRYLYCLIFDPVSVDCVYTLSAMKATYVRLKNLNVSDSDIVSIIVRGKVPPEIAINILGYLNDFDDEFLMHYAKSVSPLGSSLDFLKYLNDSDPEFYEMYLVYYVFKRVNIDYPEDVLKHIYIKLKEIQDKAPAILYLKFREECWERLKPSLNVHEKKDLY